MLTAAVLGAALTVGPPDNVRRANGTLAITTQELLTYLDQVESRQENLREEFELTWHSAEGTAEPPKEFAPSQFVFSQRVVSLYSKERYRVELTYVDAHPNLAAMKGQVHTLTWDGQEARLTTLGAHARDSRQQGARIDSLPMREFIDLPYLDWCGWWVFHNDYFEGYADLLRHSEVRGPRRAADGRTQWRIISKRAMHGEIVLTALRHVDGDVAIHSAEFRVFKSADSFAKEDTSDLILSSTILFQGARDETLRLPRRARLINRHWPTDGNDPRWGVADIRLAGTQAVEPDDAEFRAPVMASAFVADSRYNIAYQLGTHNLNVDGRLYQMHVPLEGDVGGRLQWWLERAKAIGREGGGDVGGGEPP